MRDLKVDLELCNKAIPCLQDVFTEWDGKMVLGFGVPGEHIHQLSENEYSLITQACEGWPHTLERAIEAEALNRVLVEALESMIEIVGQHVHKELLVYSEFVAIDLHRELLTKAREVLGDG